MRNVNKAGKRVLVLFGFAAGAVAGGFRGKSGAPSTRGITLDRAGLRPHEMRGARRAVGCGRVHRRSDRDDNLGGFRFLTADSVLRERQHHQIVIPSLTFHPEVVGADQFAVAFSGRGTIERIIS
jgi:hypothetical protein